MKPLLLLAGIAALLTACGSATSSKSVVLQPKGAPTSGLDVRITGSADAAPVVAHAFEHAPLVGDLAVASAVHGQRLCVRTAPLATYPATEPSLRGLDGQTIAFAVYSTHGASQLRGMCKLFSLLYSVNGAIPILGRNLTATRVFVPFMEPALRCAGDPCAGHDPDFAVVRSGGARGLRRGAIVVFNQTDEQIQDNDTMCEGQGGPAVRRVVGLPGETVRQDNRGYIYTRPAGGTTWTRLDDSYIPAKDRAAGEDPSVAYMHPKNTWRVPAGEYFVMSDNRAKCDSRLWGAVPAANIIGSVVDIIRDGKVMKPAGVPN